jgi:hypothetical protein
MSPVPQMLNWARLSNDPNYYHSGRHYAQVGCLNQGTRLSMFTGADQSGEWQEQWSRLARQSNNVAITTAGLGRSKHHHKLAPFLLFIASDVSFCFSSLPHHILQSTATAQSLTGLLTHYWCRIDSLGFTSLRLRTVSRAFLC